ncbi:MAG: hypothetical protein OEY28_07330, partial [Nitrospira sp.]|nr:hypothetical protein [Nitrospira sp.]
MRAVEPSLQVAHGICEGLLLGLMVGGRCLAEVWPGGFVEERMRHLLLLVACLLLVAPSGCKKIFETNEDPTSLFQEPVGYNPALLPSVSSASPNVGIETQQTEFIILGRNLLPNTPAVVTFGSLVFDGVTNSSGSQVISATHPTGKFLAPPGQGSVDIEVFVSGQNPPVLAIPNGFIYLSPLTPALPTIDSMSPNSGDKSGATLVTFDGTNVPKAANMQIVVSWLFTVGAVDVAAQQTINNKWQAVSPPVPPNEPFTSTNLSVDVVCTFSGGGLPAAVIVAVPSHYANGNPYTFTGGQSSGLKPEDLVYLSGASSNFPGQANSVWYRTVEKLDIANDSMSPVQGLANRTGFNGNTAFAPSGTHYYPSPVQSSGVSWREANSIYSHFVLPEFDRTYVPAHATGQSPPSPVTKPVTAKLFHLNNPETTTAPYGTADVIYAVYSTGEVDVFATGSMKIHQEIKIHHDFANYPYFAMVRDGGFPTIAIGRLDGKNFVANNENVITPNLGSVIGNIQHLSITFTSFTQAVAPFNTENYIYFSTSAGEVYKCAIDGASIGQVPSAVPCTWPAATLGSHAIVSDQLTLSGDGRNICFVAGTGTQRFTTAGAPPPSTQDIYAIRNAHQGGTSIHAVTDFGNTTLGHRQIVFWNLGDSATSTYGVSNLDNGTNSRRVFMAGVNPFGSSTNLLGTDVSVSYDGLLCSFVTREDRTLAESPGSLGTTVPWVTYYLYVARVQGTNDLIRVNSWTKYNHGAKQRFHPNMAYVPSHWWPQKVPTPGMARRLVFTVSGAGNSAGGADQHLYTADFTSVAGIDLLEIHDRSEALLIPPFEVTQSAFNYFGGFP